MIVVTSSDRDRISGISLTPTETDLASRNGEWLNSGSSAMTSVSLVSDRLNSESTSPRDC